MQERQSGAGLGIPALLFAFSASGATGLVYETLWSRYLSLWLGHAAYAQSFVIAVFMGGMAIGASLCSRNASRIARPLHAYAAVEAAIGVFAFLFHPLFTAATGLAYARVLPLLGEGIADASFRYGLAGLLILPQSVLLGATFPLMTAGIVRRRPAAHGRAVALAYFANSIGGVAGVLASGFWLLGAMGLPGTLALGGAINLAVAATVRWRAGSSAPRSLPGTEPSGPKHAVPRMLRLLLAASAVTGAASFIYEVAWIRMLTLVLGASTHAFEIMLSAFILGLALGGLWIRKRADSLTAPLWLLARIQLVMGMLAVATLPAYTRSFAVMDWLVRSLDKTEAGYLLFNLASHAVASVVMLPATFCAGMTLPLITAILLRSGAGERSIGAVYAANTFGGIVAVVFAVQVGLPRLGLTGLLASGAALDTGLGLLLLFVSREPGGRSVLARLRVPAVCFAGFGAALLFGQVSPLTLASGPYRGQGLLGPGELTPVASRDGKTSTVQILTKPGEVLFLRNNGKSEAAVTLAPWLPARPDEATMGLLAGVPAFLRPQARTTANIGFGSGVTTDLLLLGLEGSRVDTIEIEPAVVDLARAFSPRNDRAYLDPRSRIHIDDAKAFLARALDRYDVIVSEPPNPWVTGVAGLFSREFYATAAAHLTEGGVLVQWLQAYEIDMETVVSILKALAVSFEDYRLYATCDPDMLLVATPRGRLPDPEPEAFANPRLAAALHRIGVDSLDDLALRLIADRGTLGPLLATSSVPANSDYGPFVDLRAVRSRFMASSVQDLQYLDDPYPILRLLGNSRAPVATRPGENPWFTRGQRARFARLFLRSVESLPQSGPPAVSGGSRPGAVGDLLLRCSREQDGLDTLFQVATNVLPFLSPEESARLWERLETWPCSRGLGAEGRLWAALFRNVGALDGAGMARDATRLLAEERPLRLEFRAYALATGMLGYLATGRKEDAARLWASNAQQVFGSGRPRVMYRVLAAHAGVAPLPE